MHLKTQDDALVDDLAEQIVTDHLIKTFSITTLKTHSTQPEPVLEDCELRLAIINDILDMQCEKALKKINANKVDIDSIGDDLKKQIFIEALIRKEYDKAIMIARDYMAEGKLDDDLFSLLGYKEEMSFLRDFGNLDKRMWLAQKVNEEMCKNKYGRRKSGIWLLMNQHKSIMFYKDCV